MYAQLFSNIAYVVMDVVEEGYEVWQFWVKSRAFCSLLALSARCSLRRARSVVTWGPAWTSSDCTQRIGFVIVDVICCIIVLTPVAATKKHLEMADRENRGERGLRARGKSAQEGAE